MKRKVAVVTGAAGGIGRAIVRLMLRNEYAVVATDIDSSALEELHGLDGAEAGLYTHAMDVTRQESVRQVYEVVDSRFGGLDVLVNNAGVFCRTPILMM